MGAGSFVLQSKRARAPSYSHLAAARFPGENRCVVRLNRTGQEETHEALIDHPLPVPSLSVPFFLLWSCLNPCRRIAGDPSHRTLLAPPAYLRRPVPTPSIINRYLCSSPGATPAIPPRSGRTTASPCAGFGPPRAGSAPPASDPTGSLLVHGDLPPPRPWIAYTPSRVGLLGW